MSHPSQNLQTVQQAQQQNHDKADALAVQNAAGALRSFLDKQTDALKAAIQRRMPLDFVLSTFYSAVRAQPRLMECSPSSLLACILQSVQLDLRMDPTLGEAWLVPFKNKKTGRLEAQFIPGYRGFIKRAYANSQVRSIHADLVYEKDTFTYRMGTEEVLLHEPNIFGDRGELLGAYAYARLANGGFISVTMDYEELEKVRKTSKAGGDQYGSWTIWTDEMRLKTVIRRLFKRLPNLPQEVNDMITLEEKTLAGQPQGLSIELLDVTTGELPAPEPVTTEDPDTDESKNIVAGFEDAIKEAKTQPELRNVLSLVDAKLAEKKISTDQRNALIEKLGAREDVLLQEAPAPVKKPTKQEGK